ncbi:MAG: TetR/AcrR family transcriptional regulator [Actinomycetota bacterium]
MTASRRYVSPKRAAQAEATRRAILEAFREQLIEPGRQSLSPTEAAASAGCSVRTVHGHFPTKESRVAALAELLEGELYVPPLTLPERPADLPDHYRRIHRSALESPLAAALMQAGGAEWQEIRSRRRADRLDAVRRVATGIGAPDAETERVTAILLALAGAEVTLSMRDQLGIDPDDIPEALAYAVELLLADLERSAAAGGDRRNQPDSAGRERGADPE